MIPRERERREKAEREKNLSYENVEWEKLLLEDLLKKQRFWHLKRNLPKKGKLNLVSAHIQLSAAIQSVLTRRIKMQVTLKQTAAQKQAKRVVRTMLCRKLRVIPPSDEWRWWWWQCTLAKLASISWKDGDSKKLSVLAKHCQLFITNSWHNWNNFSLSVYCRSIVFLVAV